MLIKDIDILEDISRFSSITEASGTYMIMAESDFDPNSHTSFWGNAKRVIKKLSYAFIIFSVCSSLIGVLGFCVRYKLYIVFTPCFSLLRAACCSCKNSSYNNNSQSSTNNNSTNRNRVNRVQNNRDEEIPFQEFSTVA
jgi:hypothetical protein